MKRLLPVLLIGLLVFVGCGGDSAQQPTDTAPAEVKEKVLTFAKPAEPPEDLSATLEGTSVVLTWTPNNPGDYNSDGVVNGMDVFRIASRFGQHSNFNGQTADEPDNDCIDGTEDGNINGLDLFLISTNFDRTVDGFNVYERMEGDRDPTQINTSLVEFIAPTSPACVALHTFEDTTTTEGVWHYSVTVRQGVTGESDNSGEQHINISYTIPPDAPKEIIASDAGYDGFIRLWWEESQLADGYKLYRSDSMDGVYDFLADANQPPIWDGSRYDDSVAENTTYWYKVSAWNEFGEGEMSPADSGYWDSDVLIPPVPENLTVTLDQYEGYIICQWDSSVGAESYRLYRSAVNGETGEVILDDPGRLHVDFPPELETDYYYSVSAVNGVGESNTSDQEMGRALAFTSTGEIADTPWPTFRHDLQGTGSSDIWGPADEVPSIDLFIDLPTNTTITVTPIINTEGNLVVTTDEAIYEVSLPGGAIVNTIPFAGSDVTPLVSDSGAVYQIDSEQILHSFLPGIWVEAWANPLGGTGSTKGLSVSSSGHVIAGSGPGVDSVGTVAYARGGEDYWSQPNVATDTCAPVWATDMSAIFIGDNSRRLYALDPDDGSVLDGFPVNLLADSGSVTYLSPLAVFRVGSQERVLACNGSGLLYCYDQWGELVFSQILHGIGSQLGAVYSSNSEDQDKRVVAICSSDPVDDDTFWVVGYLHDGGEFWRNPNVEPYQGRVIHQPVICAGPDDRDYILFGTLDGHYYCIDVIDGSDQWNSDFEGTAPPATGGFCLNSDGCIYFGTTEGRIFKLSSTTF